MSKESCHGAGSNSRAGLTRALRTLLYLVMRLFPDGLERKQLEQIASDGRGSAETADETDETQGQSDQFDVDESCGKIQTVSARIHPQYGRHGLD